MRTQKRWIAFLALAVGTALLVLGCSSNTPPATTDVAKAMVAGSMAQSETAQYKAGADYTVSTNYTPGNTLTITATNPLGGSALVSFTETAPGSYPWILTGSIAFTNWYDTITGYTVSGTLNVVDTISSASVPINGTIKLTGNLSLQGGTIDSLSYNILETTTGGVPSVTGTITANGYTFDVSQL